MSKFWKRLVVYSCALALCGLALSLLPESRFNNSTLASSALSPWSDTDIGAVGTPGSASTNSGTYSISGSGADIYGTADAFHYVYQPISGDCQIVARVTSVQDTYRWSKCGVMIRESLSPGSRHANMLVSAAMGSAFQRRLSTSGDSTSTAGAAVAAPYWIKLSRSGNTFTGYISSNGSSWTQVGSDTISMASNVYVGLAVTSHDNPALCTSLVDSIAVQSTTAEKVLLSDAFDSTSIDRSLWTVGNVFSGYTDASIPVNEASQGLQIGPLYTGQSGSHYNGIKSVSTYDFTGAYGYVQIATPPNSSTAADAMFTLGQNSSNYYRIYVEQGKLIAQKCIGGTKSNLYSATYSSTNDQFVRIRHDSTAGKVIFETAPPSGAWTQVASDVWNNSAIPVTRVLFELKAGTWQSESNAPGTVVFDNFRAAAPMDALQPPTVSIGASPLTGTAPLSVNFTSSASSPNGAIASYNWTFGDGQSSTSASPSHVYQTTGSMSVRLTVTDMTGATATASTTVTVNNAATSGSAQFKVMQCNIQWGQGTDEVYDLNRQANYMVLYNPDVISLNETPTYANQAQQFATLLTQKTGVTWNYFFVPISAGNNVGQTILTKWPIVSTSSYYLYDTRSVAEATISINGKRISFFSTHLDDVASSNRIVEVGQLLTFMSGFAEPRIVAGDFNSWPEGTEVLDMNPLYYDSWDQAISLGIATAYPPDNPVDPINTRTRKSRLDYVFYSKGATNLTLNAARVPDTRDLTKKPVELLGTADDKGVRPSDHNWYLVTFTVH